MYPTKKLSTAGILLTTFVCAQGAAAQTIRTVRAAGPGAAAPWNTAVTDLQVALAAAEPGDQIWVSAGTYRPAPANGTRTVSFVIPPGVQIYGGFAGSEATLAQRDASLAPGSTILSGDLNGNGTLRSYRVVVINGGAQGVLLDRLTIRDGSNFNTLNLNTPLNLGAAGVVIVSGTHELRDCTITANAGGPYYQGGAPTVDGALPGGGLAIDTANVTLTRCVISSNTTASGASNRSCDHGTAGTASTGGDGAGVFARGGTLTIIGGSISLNTTGGGGGGLGCSFQSNIGARGGSGAGIYASNTDVTIRKCAIFSNNTGPGGPGGIFGGDSQPNGAGGSGAGVYVTGGSAIIDSCRFASNLAGRGGEQSAAYGTTGGPGGSGAGLCLSSLTKAVVVNSLFSSNIAGAGGNGRLTGFGCRSDGGPAGSGGAISVSACPLVSIVNCTIAYNAYGTPGTGTTPPTPCTTTFPADCCTPGSPGLPGVGGVVIATPVGGTLTFANNILWGNVGVQLGGVPSPSYCCIQGGTTANGNVNTDPRFNNVTLSDFRLGLNSPCIDAGWNAAFQAAAPSTATDLTGDPRFADVASVPDTGVGLRPIIDMGCYEHAKCPADFNNSGTISAQDIFDFLAAWFAGC